MQIRCTKAYGKALARCYNKARVYRHSSVSEYRAKDMQIEVKNDEQKQ